MNDQRMDRDPLTRAAVRLRMTLRVGISGHRELADPGQWKLLRPRLHAVLGEIQKAAANAHEEAGESYAVVPPVLRATSPLAEGADRLLAEEALALGYELQCPLPFDREEYRKDFRSQDGPHPPSIDHSLCQHGNHPQTSVDEFDGLLNQAIAVFELDGPCEERGRAYEAVGRALLDHSDILVVIWDGLPAQGRGGTEQIKQLALDRNKPVIWLQTDSKKDTSRDNAVYDDRLLWHRSANPDQPVADKVVRDMVKSLLLPPWIRNHQETESDLTAFDAGHLAKSEILLGRVLDRTWKTFTRAMSMGVRVSPGASAVEASLLLHDPFGEQYRLANEPAKRFAGLYRGAFLAITVAGVAAVFLALLGHSAKQWEHVWVWCELATIAIALTLVFLVHDRRWHHRAVDCRYLAEQLRILRYTYPLGLTVIEPRFPAHYLHEDLSTSWMHWRLMAIVRSVPLPAHGVNQTLLRQCYNAITHDWVAGQLEYHEDNKVRLRAIEERLRNLGWVFFAAAAVACLAHLYSPLIPWGPWLTLCAAGLPAAAAACHAISNQGEFRRLWRRSEAMEASLLSSHRRLLEKENHLSADTLQRAATDAAHIMLDEVVDWQILYRKPVEAA